MVKMIAGTNMRHRTIRRAGVSGRRAGATGCGALGGALGVGLGVGPLRLRASRQASKNTAIHMHKAIDKIAKMDVSRLPMIT